MKISGLRSSRCSRDVLLSVAPRLRWYSAGESLTKRRLVVRDLLGAAGAALAS